MTISQITTIPNRNTQDAATYVTNANGMMAAIPILINEINETVAGINFIAAGGGFTMPYTFSSTTTDTDPGPGFLRLDNATQNLATTIRTDLIGADGVDWSAVLSTFSQSTSTIKGQIRLTKTNDATKWMVFNFTTLTSPSGYKNLSIAVIGASATNPFVSGDALILSFTRSGDIGPPGSILRRVTTITSSSTPTPNASTDDVLTITALAVSATIAAPINTPLDGQGLVIRIKDNGTARGLSYNGIYRASTDLALPSTTVISKTLYIGFVYNATDTKWDLVAVLNNI